MGLWIKICGITREEDARIVEQSGATALGLIFSETSPRNITIQQAEKVCAAVSSSVEKVAVVVHPDWNIIETWLRYLPINTIQWHGGPLTGEDVEHLSSFGIPWIHAIRWDGKEALSAPSEASRILVEGRSDKALGGTGISWEYRRLLGAKNSHPLILSGGLSPESVGTALRSIGKGIIMGVDVSSGVERTPGIKDPEKVRNFVQQVRDWERAQCAER